MEVFDREAALRRANGDEELVKRRCAAFVDVVPATIRSLEHDYLHKDIDALQRHARELEASCEEVGAAGAGALAHRLATASDTGDWPEIASLLTKLEMELEWFQRIFDDNRCSGNL